MRCKDCDYCHFSSSVNGKNRYICTHHETLRVVVHSCKRGGNDYPKKLPDWCPKRVI